MPNEGVNYKIIPQLYLLLATIIVTVLVWYTIDIFLLAFAGILLAIVIRSVSYFIERFSYLPNYIAVTVVLVTLMLFLVLSKIACLSYHSRKKADYDQF